MTDVPFLDLSREYKEISADWLAALGRITAAGRYLQGEETKAFESEFAAYTGAAAAIAAANGTDALTIALHAAGIGEGDEVITTPYTFFATVEAILRRGARPVFADINAHDFNLDSEAAAASITPKTRAVLAVHIFGAPMDMDALSKLAREHKLAVIEDCAQSCGAQWNGKQTGSFGDFGCFSFYPSKVLGCYGDGGMITARSPESAAYIRRLSNHGAMEPFIHQESGYNNRLDEIQAALLRIKLRRLEQAIARRRAIAGLYTQALAGLPLIAPAAPEKARHAFGSYTIRSPQRDKIRAALAGAGIGSALYYPLPLHRQPFCQKHGCMTNAPLPEADRAAAECLSLPIFPELRDEEALRAAEIIRQTLT